MGSSGLVSQKDIAIKPSEKMAEYKETARADRMARNFACTQEQSSVSSEKP